MPFAYRADQIIEIVKARKVPRLEDFLAPGEPIPFQVYGEKGRRIDVLLDLVNGPLVDLRFHVRGPILDNPETYEASLVLSGRRIRGIGWNPTARSRFYRQMIPKGWHENMIDPNRDVSSTDYNRHLPLVDFEVTDLTDFFMKASKHWNIELRLQEELW
jgi:hypothetical protein